MSKTSLHRYPGSIPFERSQAELFFGRDNDIEGLYRHINVNRLTVLHGKSGLGKSSLLNAGLEPRVEREGFHTVKIRFTSYDRSREDAQRTNPLLLFKQQIRAQAGAGIFLPEIEKDESKLTVWQLFKQLEWQQQQAGQKGVLLVFDQFEEIFTWPTGLEDFGREFSDLALNRMPADFQTRYFEKIAADPAALEPKSNQIDFMEQGLHLRIVLSIRSDRLSLLDRLSPWLPKILQNNYELRPLDLPQAELAIVRPAAKTGDFVSPQFNYEPDAVREMLDYLSDSGRKPIESFQLQVLCRHLENRVKSGEIQAVTAENLGDIEDVYKNFYGSTLAEFADDGERLGVQKFIEEGLIFVTKEESRRIPMYEGLAFLQWKISPESLRKLVDLHLVRAEAHPSGGFFYELCHDSMLAPIVEIREQRMGEERRLAEEIARQEEAEKLAAERRRAESEAEIERARLQKEADHAWFQAEKDRRQKRIAFWLAALAVLFALVAFWAGRLAVLQSKEAERQSELAQKNEQKAISALDEATKQRGFAETNADSARRQTILAQQQRRLADQKTLEANDNARLARLNENAAREALDQLKLSQNQTEDALKKAEANYQEARRERENAEAAKNLADQRLQEIITKNEAILKSLLTEAEAFILQIKYDEAAAKLVSAMSIGERNAELVRLLKEIAWFKNEAGQAAEAVQFLLFAAQIRQPGSLLPSVVASSPTVREDIRQALRALDEGQFIALENRYFPVMRKIPGGKFRMGSLRNIGEQPVHEQTVADFEMAETETTVWQFALFCVENGLDLQAFDPTRQFDGREPMANISWSDAASYADWLNRRAGFQPIYDVAKTSQNRPTNQPGWRLPTEAEWEFAARSGGGENQFSGSGIMDDAGWYLGNSEGRLHAVRLKNENGLRLFDLSGNVREWCNDVFGPYPTGLKTGSSSSVRAQRGGSFRDFRNFCTTTARQGSSEKSADTGFRLVRH